MKVLERIFLNAQTTNHIALQCRSAGGRAHNDDDDYSNALDRQVDRLEDELVAEQEKHKAITEELEQTFAEMSGY